MLATFWTWTNVNRNVVVTHINSSSSPCCNVFYDFLHPLQTCTNERLCVFDNFKIFQDAFQDLHWGHAYTVAVSCWVVGKETCAAPAAAHVCGQCRACSCSHHIVSGQPFVPSRLSHLAVHGTIDRTIRRFCTRTWPPTARLHSLTLSCLYILYEIQSFKPSSKWIYTWLSSNDNVKDLFML